MIILRQGVTKFVVLWYRYLYGEVVPLLLNSGDAVTVVLRQCFYFCVAVIKLLLWRVGAVTVAVLRCGYFCDTILPP